MTRILFVRRSSNIYHTIRKLVFLMVVNSCLQIETNQITKKTNLRSK